MKNYFIAIAALCLVLFSCKKESSNNSSSSSSSGTTSSTYFIEGKVDGTMVHCEYVCPNPGCAEIAGHYDNFMAQVVMQRTTSSTDSKGWDIVISNVNLDSWQVPDTLDASSLFNNENLDLSYYSGTWESDNNYMVDGVVMGDNSFVMKVTSKTGDVLEGTFSGELRNGSDDSIRKHVTEGKFKIKLVRY